MERISFETEDQVTIVGQWEDVSVHRGVALLLHMMPEDKGSWQDTQRRLASAGISSLAIDLRGHGESVFCDEHAHIDYRDFDDSGHQQSRLDVDGAVRWISEKTGDGADRLVLVGASIGANLALQYAASHRDIPAVAALSPGLDYRGITAIPSVSALTSAQKLLLVASNDDPYSAQTIEQLSKLSRTETEIIRLNTAGHGSNMFKAEPTLADKVVYWVSSVFAAPS